MDSFLDKFFIVFHTVFVLFILFGWIWQKTRKLNLILLLLTLFSWMILGIWFGIGYCPLTHWHWQVRSRMGLYDMPASYIKFLLDMFTGWDWNAQLVDILTAVSFSAAFITSLLLNISKRKKSK